MGILECPDGKCLFSYKYSISGLTLKLKFIMNDVLLVVKIISIYLVSNDKYFIMSIGIDIFSASTFF